MQNVLSSEDANCVKQTGVVLVVWPLRGTNFLKTFFCAKKLTFCQLFFFFVFHFVLFSSQGCYYPINNFDFRILFALEMHSRILLYKTYSVWSGLGKIKPWKVS